MTVLVFGTFDALHSGHRYFLLRARSFGDRLVVSLARDEFVRSFKGKIPSHDENERLARLEASGLADQVCLSDPIPGSYDILSRVEPDLVCLGYDQSSLEADLRGWLEGRKRRIPLLMLEPMFRREGDGVAAGTPRAS